MSRLVYPVDAMVSYWEGRPHRLTLDEPWDADDPFVKAHPDLFKDGPDYVASVEQATSAPGEKRTTRTRRKPAQKKSTPPASQ